MQGAVYIMLGGGCKGPVFSLYDERRVYHVKGGAVLDRYFSASMSAVPRTSTGGRGRDVF